MNLKREQHHSFPEVSEELQNLERGKEDAIQFGNRVPNSSDKGRFWIYMQAATVNLYVRNQSSGTWIKLT